MGAPRVRPCRHRGHEHDIYVYDGGVKVEHHPAILCARRGRYVPRSVCDACVHYEPAEERVSV